MTRTKYLQGECQECGGSFEFPAETAGTSTECPHCGRQTELLLALPPDKSSVPRRAILYTVAGILILVIGLVASLVALKYVQRLAARRKAAAAATAPAASHANAPRVVDLVAQTGLRVSMITLEKTPGSSLHYAVGTVRNESGRRRIGLKVELNLFDNTGKKVGTATDHQQVLEPNAEWRFKTPVVESKTASVRLASIKEGQ